MRLLQTGFNNVRVPLNDLLDSGIAEDVHRYRTSGIRFHAMTLGFPDAGQLQQLGSKACEAVSIEVVLPSYPEAAGSVLDLGAALQEVRDETDIPIWLGAAVSSSKQHSAQQSDSTVFAHTVTSGFLVKDCELVLGALAEINSRASGLLVKGAVFQIPWESDLHDAITVVSACCDNYPGLAAQLIIRFAPANPANCNFDDEAIAVRTRDALDMVEEHSSLSVQFDTFSDIDRGYAPRHGFVDRRFNLRAAGLQLTGYT